MIGSCISGRSRISTAAEQEDGAGRQTGQGRADPQAAPGGLDRSNNGKWHAQLFSQVNVFMSSG
ncbi:hypothetical protein MICRO11B_410017 [Micrococcus luteus]|nr:hypothetical protein MICRO116_370012 [Micrococcus sp. 116]VXB65108.1 hypothetical protein MICRO11B_410017 [Micrococcus luteus]